MIQQINDCVKQGESFAFETTFSGKGYAEKIRNWKSLGYEVIIYYLKLPSVDFAIERVRLRVTQGGHNVSEDVIRRRYDRSWKNFQNLYKQLADSWTLFDTSGNMPIAIETAEVK